MLATILNDLSIQYSVTIEYASEVNKCYIAGRTISIGNYSNPEFLLISYFHEIGHLLITREYIERWEYNTLQIELECWRIGIEEAKRNNILFSDIAIEFGYKQALTYVGHDERECSNWGENYGKKLFIHK